MAEVFQMFGKRPSLREMLNSLEREGAIVLAMPFNILPDKPSGPLALPGSRDAVITFSGVICVCVLNSPSDSHSDDMHMQLLHAHSVPACTRSGSPHNVLHSSSNYIINTHTENNTSCSTAYLTQLRF